MVDTIKPQNLVLFVLREGMQLYDALNGRIVTLAFDPKMIRDMDVIDAGLLTTAIHTFIAQSKILPAGIMFVFSEQVVFYQDVKETEGAELKAQVAEFINMTPFETVLTRVYNAKGATRIAAINERLFGVIVSAFENKGFKSVGVIPTFVLGGKLAAATSLDAALARNILERMEELKEQSFVINVDLPEKESEETPVFNESEAGSAQQSKKVKLNTRMLVLVGIFVVLLVVFGFLLITRVLNV